MPAGTLLYGQLWMNEKERVAYGRWTEAELPGGKKVPVCLTITRYDTMYGRVGYKWSKGSTPGAVRMPKELMVSVVNRWP